MVKEGFLLSEARYTGLASNTGPVVGSISAPEYLLCLLWQTHGSYNITTSSSLHFDGMSIGFAGHLTLVTNYKQLW
jgi:hypothetical protein